MKNDSTVKVISRQLLNTVEQFNKYDKKARNFGTDHKLYFSEIHLIEFIGKHPNCHVSGIAEGINVTKGAISQMVKKLERKGFLFKTIDADNKSRTLVFLTKKGQKAFEEHQKYHEYLANLVNEALDGFSLKEIKAIYKFLNKMEYYWK